jgi:nucleoside permease NupC
MTSNEKPQRERVVLAHRRGARMVRTRVEVQEQTQVGDALVRGLMRAQLGLALRLAAVVVCAVVAIPLLNAAFPDLAAVTVVGIRLNWLVLAVLVYPLLYGVGRLYVRLAEQAERDFVGVVDSEP